MPALSTDWFLGVIDALGSFGISVSLQDDDKPYLKWFFVLKTRDQSLAEKIQTHLNIGTVRRVGRRWCLIVERVGEIDTLTQAIDFSQLRSPTTHRTFNLWHAAFLRYRALSPYERRQARFIIPILKLRDDLNSERKTPHYNACESICRKYGWKEEPVVATVPSLHASESPSTAPS